MNRIEEIKAELLRLDNEESRRIAGLRAEISEAQETLAPLDEEVRRGLAEGSSRFMAIRAARAAALATIERAHGEMSRPGPNGYRVKELREHLEQALRVQAVDDFYVLTDEELASREEKARATVTWWRKSLADQQSVLPPLEQRLIEARRLLDSTPPELEALQELRKQRKKILSDAFIKSALNNSDFGRWQAERQPGQRPAP